MPLHLVTSESFTGKEAVSIGTGFMGVTTATPLLSLGASYCLIIVFHADGVGGAIAHVPPGVDELPAMEKMMDALVKRGARPGQVEVLLGGGAMGDYSPTWRQNFLTKLGRAGIQLGNIIDARTGTPEFPRIPIGNKEVDRLKNAVYDPKSSQILPLNEWQTHGEKGKSSSVKVYAIASANGAVSAMGQDGACVIL